MKTKKMKILMGVFACGVALLLSSQLSAATRSWTGWGNDGGGNAYHNDWSDVYSWNGQNKPADDLTTDLTQFMGTAAWNANRYAVNVDESFSVNGINLGGANGFGGFTFSSSNGSVLTVGQNGIRSTSDSSLTSLSALGAGADIINVAVVLGTATNQTFVSVAANGTLTFNESMNFNAMGNYNVTLNVVGSLVSNGILIGNTVSTGVQSRIIKEGAGSWTINNDNRATLTSLTGTGDIRLQAGTIYLTSNGALGTSRLTSTNSTGERALIIGKEGVIVDSGVDIRFLPGANNAAHTLTIGGNNTSGVVAFENELRLSAANISGAANSRATKVTAEAGGTVIFRGAISNLASGTENRKGSIEKIGLGTVIFEGVNVYNDTDDSSLIGTTVSEGALLFNNTSGSGAGAKDVLVKAGATSGGAGSISGNMTLQDGAFLSIGYGRVAGFTIGGGLTLEGDLAIAWGGDIGTLAIGGALDLGGNMLTFDLNGYTGATFNLITWDSIVGNAATDVVVNNLGSAYTINIGANGIEITAIPEPSTYTAIMALGVLAFVAYRSRRK